MPQQMQEVRIECHTGLGSETPILIGDQLIDMNKLHIGYSGQNVKTFAVNPSTYQIDECHILEVPQQVFVPNTIKIGLHYGFHFECTPGSLILSTEGFKHAENLKKGDKLQVLTFNAENGQSFMEEGEITVYEYNTEIQLQVPVYLFISEYENILLPYYKEGSKLIAFIDVKQ